MIEKEQAQWKRIREVGMALPFIFALIGLISLIYAIPHNLYSITDDDISRMEWFFSVIPWIGSFVIGSLPVYLWALSTTKIEDW